MSRPPSITLKIEKKELKLSDSKIKQLLKSRVRGHSKSGAYIPMSQEYKDHEVFVIVMEKK
jgi:hypothetical protein